MAPRVKQFSGVPQWRGNVSRLAFDHCQARPGQHGEMTMTTLILAAAHQMPRASGLAEVALLSGFGLFVSLLFVHFGIDLGTVG